MRKISDILYCDTADESHLLDIYLPDSDEFPVLIYIHGGGFESGNKSEGETNFPYLASKGIAVVSINYRLYPEAKYPEFIEDAAKAVSWVYENMKNYGKCTKFYICGTSAGAYTTMMLCFNDKYLKPYGIAPTDIDGFIHNAGQPTAHFNVLKERGVDPRRVIIDETAPMYYVGMSKALPPMLFLVADNDMACRYEQLSLMVRTLEHFEYNMDKIKLTVLHGNHCQYIFDVPAENGSAFCNEILDFIENN